MKEKFSCNFGTDERRNSELSFGFVSNQTRKKATFLISNQTKVSGTLHCNDHSHKIRLFLGYQAGELLAKIGVKIEHSLQFQYLKIF